jgi:hypothetical protein
VGPTCNSLDYVIFICFNSNFRKDHSDLVAFVGTADVCQHIMLLKSFLVWVMYHLHILQYTSGAHGSIVGGDTMLQARRSQVQVPMRWIIFYWPNHSSCTMALGSTQPLTEMSTSNLPGG